ncbi:manganese efflux pump MntP family protein [Niallia circulans]|uniref:manganese efflux pump MntP n=1 Tax=Niallia circulans TaxID=1397 RepID=UPI001F3955EB|nr:manganese efflux pump MntP family protein [Niallia circulans]MCF2649640.1 manganese efflux pump [Niallia circulans]
MSAIVGELFTLILMAFALGMDAFSVGLGMGMFQLRLKQIAKIGLVIGIFHVIMPLLGMITGKLLSENFSEIAGYIGGALLVLLGIQMIWTGFKEVETSRITPVGFGLVLFAVSVSLDSFSVGLSLGIYQARTVVVLLCFGIIAMVLTWLGLLIGRKVKGWLGSYGEMLGGAILLVFGIKLLISFTAVFG